MSIQEITNTCIIACLICFSLQNFSYCDENRQTLKPEDLPVISQSKPVQSVDYKSVEEAADRLFYAGLETNDQNLKEAYLSQALVKYMLLLSINPKDTICCTQIGVIHDHLNHPKMAKDYLYQAINIEPNNPFANFYSGEYYFRKRQYYDALKYYLVAYRNGYQNFYEINLKLGTIYEKLGDIEKAKIYFNKARKQNSNSGNLESKLKSLNSVYYRKTDYKK